MRFYMNAKTEMMEIQDLIQYIENGKFLDQYITQEKDLPSFYGEDIYTRKVYGVICLVSQIGKYFINLMMHYDDDDIPVISGVRIRYMENENDEYSDRFLDILSTRESLEIAESLMLQKKLPLCNASEDDIAVDPFNQDHIIMLGEDEISDILRTRESMNKMNEK